jgi:biotin carboxyl carrier protein
MSLRYRLRIADREVIAEVLRRDGCSIEYDVNGQRYEVNLEGLFEAPSENTSPRAERATQGSPQPSIESSSGQSRAPMPGIVVQVLVEVGQTVSVGDPLLVLEAMKMENSVLAQRSGIVREVLVSKGADVQRGQVLLRIE